MESIFVMGYTKWFFIKKDTKRIIAQITYHFTLYISPIYMIATHLYSYLTPYNNTSQMI